MNRRIFFNYARNAPFGGRLTSQQVDGLNRILDEWQRRGLTDDRWLAYMLATAFWETAKTIQPVREKGGESYLRSKRYYPWVGEGLVQVTWEVNHRKFGATKPGQLMTWPIALKALFDGCINGMFTGKKLSHYFNATVDDPRGARRIVNGTDKAELIAGFHRQFLSAIKAAKLEAPDVEPDKATERNAEPDDVPASQSKSLWSILLGLVTGGGFAFPNIENLYGLIAFLAILTVGGIVAWLVLSGRISFNRVS